MPEPSIPSNPVSPAIGDLAGVGLVINSEVAKQTYNDALSPAMKQLGGLTADTLKTLRLFTAPIQLLAAYQDRFSAFCNRVREKVPEEEQQEAPPEIVRPVMEAFAFTSDGSPLMEMFEQLMTRAIDRREANKLSPEFPSLIQSLSPLEALLIAELKKGEHLTDDLFDRNKNMIVQRVHANFDFAIFGGQNHHLTLSQKLKASNLVSIEQNLAFDPTKEYPHIKVPEGHSLQRMRIRLTMFGEWFAKSCLP